MKKLVLAAMTFAAITASAGSATISVGEEGLLDIRWNDRAPTNSPVVYKCYSTGESSHEVACSAKAGKALQNFLNRVTPQHNGRAVNQFQMVNGG